MSNFEQGKNLKASTYTILLVGGLLIISFLIAWTPPPTAEITEEEGMEVNLGNSETGEGDIQPLLPGDPIDLEESAKPTPPPPAQEEPPVKEIETNDNDLEALHAVIKKPVETPKKKPAVKPTPEIPKPESKPVEAPPAPKAKFVYKGQSSNTGNQGGNNSDTYQPSNGQGVAGGKGDQGKPNGSANSDSYTGNGGPGNGGGSGVSISRGLQGRGIRSKPSFEEDFNENAKIAVDIKIDTKGNVLSATIQPRGTTTGNISMKSIALQKARQLKFTADENGPEEQLGTIVFNFRIN
jgi:outer membrane biosynthesis protein TonB